MRTRLRSSHEATEIPFEETIADLLTQLFVSAGVSLHTSILVDDLESVPVVGEKSGGRKGNVLL